MVIISTSALEVSIQAVSPVSNIGAAAAGAAGAAAAAAAPAVDAAVDAAWAKALPPVARSAARAGNSEAGVIRYFILTSPDGSFRWKEKQERMRAIGRRARARRSR